MPVSESRNLTERELQQAVEEILAETAGAAGPGSVDLTPASLAAAIDHTLLKAQADSDQVRELCATALDYHFAAVCVNPTWVPLSAALLEDSDVAIATVIGFPLGATLSEVKAFEAQAAMETGATELDMVINIGALKSRRYDVVQDDIAAVVEVASGGGALVKVIIEACYLTDAEKVAACLLARAAGADYVKTSTGFGSGGATVADVALVRRTVGPGLGVKAAGGIRSLADAQAMLAAGATRIGTSSGARIVEELVELAAAEKGRP